MNNKELIQFAEYYLANNAAESGTDELIRMLVAALRKRNLTDIHTPFLKQPAWCGHCGGTCQCGEYE